MKKIINYLLTMSVAIGIQLPLWMCIDYMSRFDYPEHKQLAGFIFLIIGIVAINSFVYSKRKEIAIFKT